MEKLITSCNDLNTLIGLAQLTTRRMIQLSFGSKYKKMAVFGLRDNLNKVYQVLDIIK